MRKNATKVVAVMLSAALAVTSANIPSTTSSAAQKVKLNAKKATLYIGGPSSKNSKKLQLTVGGKKVKATFTSSKKKIAKVGKKSGKVVAKKKGKTVITAKYKGKKYKCKVTVKKYQYVTKVSVTPPSVTLNAGQSKALKVAVAPAKATVKAVTYTTSNKAVATVSGKGVIKAIKAGTAKITVAATDGSKKKAVVTVTVKSKSNGSTATSTPTKDPSQTTEPTATTDPTGTTDPTSTTDPTATTDPTSTTDPTTPTDVKLTAVSSTRITKDGDNFVVALSLSNDSISVLDNAKSSLKGTTISLTCGDNVVSATFKEVDADNQLVYQIDAADVSKLTPRERKADGTYTIAATGTTSSILTINSTVTALYEESMKGMAFSGYVTTEVTVDRVTKKVGIQNATVTVSDGGQTTTTDENGWYKVASASGSKYLTVKADNYLDVQTARLQVNKNNTTSQNIQMTKFDIDKVVFNVLVTDKDGKTPVEGAKVTIKDSNGNVVKGVLGMTTTKADSVVTDARGYVTIANASALPANIKGATDANVLKAEKAGAPILNSGGEYTVTVEKPISKTNLHDVYQSQTDTEKLVVQNCYTQGDHEFKVTKVKEIKSLKINQEIASDIESGIVNNAGKVTADYAIYTTVVGDGKTPVELLEMTADTNNVSEKIDEKTKIAAIDLLAATSVSANAALVKTNKKPTLPSGDYYVVIKPEKKTGDVKPATAAVKVTVTEGGDASASVKLTRGYARDFVTAVGLKAAENDAQGIIAAGENLQTVTYDTDAKKYKPNNDKVTVDYKIGQKFGDVVVPITSQTDAEVTSVLGKLGAITYSASSSTDELLSYGEYQITSAGTYLEDVNEAVSVDGTVSDTIQFNVKDRWNLATVKATVAEGSASELLALKAAELKLTKVVIKKGNTEVISADKLAIGGTGGSDPLEKGDVVSFDVSSVAKLATADLEAGTYTIEYTIQDKKNIEYAVSVKQDFVGLEKATSLSTAKIEKVTSTDVASVSGTVTVIDDEKKAWANSDVETTASKGLVVLLDSNGNIAGASEIDANGKYEIKDGAIPLNAIVGGEYTVVLRMAGAETVAETVTIPAKEGVTLPLKTKAGAIGVVQATVQDENNNAINDKYAPKAYDKWYKDHRATVKNWGNIVADITGTGDNGAIDPAKDLGINIWDDAKYAIGFYTGTLNGKTATIEGLPVGTYTFSNGLGLWDYGTNLNKTDYQFRNETVEIESIGDKAYYTFEKYALTPTSPSVGNEKIDLTIKTATALANGGEYVIEIENEKTGEKIVEYANQTNAAVDKTIAVPGYQTYTVRLYTNTGNLVAEELHKSVEYATSVTFAVVASSSN